MTKSLSPAAAAVWKAFEHADCDPYLVDPREAGLAAALRAAADQVVPAEPHPSESQFWDDEANQEWQNNQHFRRQLLDIAAELEGGQ